MAIRREEFDLFEVQPLKLLKEMPTYQFHRVGDNVGLVTNDANLSNWINEDTRESRQNMIDSGTVKFYKITNAKWMARDTRAVASASLPAAAASFALENATNWVNWLEASNGTLYDMVIGFKSDQITEWEVRLPKSTVIGGIQGTPENRWTQDQLVHAYSYTPHHGGEQGWFPVFTCYNRSAYTLKLAKVGVIGMKYGLSQPLKTEPEVKNWVTITDVTTR